MLGTMAQTKDNKLCELKFKYVIRKHTYTHMHTCRGAHTHTRTEQQVSVQPAATVSGQAGTDGRLGEDEDRDPFTNKHTCTVCGAVY